MLKSLSVLQCALLLTAPLNAKVRGGGDASRANVQNRSANVNRNTNVNRNANANVNRNANVNVNRNVDVNVHGGCCARGVVVVDDNHYNGWGAFAAGAAVGAVTTAAVASAARPSTTTVVVQAPALGSVYATLPAGCGVVSAGEATLYNCNNVYYRPYYQGTSLVYQVTTYP